MGDRERYEFVEACGECGRPYWRARDLGRDDQGRFLERIDVRYLTDAAFHAQVKATIASAGRDGVDLTRVPVAVVLNYAEQVRGVDRG